MKRRSLLAATLVFASAQALVLLGACATDASSNAPLTAPDPSTRLGDAESRADADVASDVDAGPCTDCELFPATCSPDALCANGPFDPNTPTGGANSFDLRTEVNAILGRSATDVWLAGTVGALAHFDGTSWKRTGPDTKESLQALWLPSQGELVFGSKLNRVYVHGLDLPEGSVNFPSDAGWSSDQRLATPPEYGLIQFSFTFTSAWWSPDANWIWCGLSNTAYFSQGTTGLWRMRRLPDSTFEIQTATDCSLPCDSEGIASIHGTTANVLWAVGSKGQAFRIDDADGDEPNIRPFNSQTFNQLHGVWAVSESEAWAVGVAGTIRHYLDGSPIAEIVSGVPSNVNLRAIWGTSNSDIWAVGDAGVVLHYDGKDWRRVKVAGLGARRPDFTAVWSPSPGHVWIGGQGVILSLGGQP